MRMNFTILLLLGALITYAQDTITQKSTKDIFFNHQAKYLMRDGGYWETVNPEFSKEVQYSARSFRYEISEGIHNQQLKLKIKSDIKDVGWYLSWDGYYLWNPRRNEINYHSLGGDGSIARGTVLIPDMKTHINVFEIQTYEGKITHYKDVTREFNDNEMQSETYQFNENGDWVLKQKFVWKRIKKN